MGSLQGTDIPFHQKFKVMDDTPLVSLPTHICTETGKRYVLWVDVQDAFKDLDHVQDPNKSTVLFMIDNNGHLCQPFCIRYYPRAVYKVIYRDFSDHQVHDNGPDLVPEEWSTYLKNRGSLCMELYQRLDPCHQERRKFQQIAANARYYHSTLVQEVGRLKRAGLTPQVEETRFGNKLKDLRRYEQQLPQWEHDNNCLSLFYGPEHRLDYPMPDLFVVLPSDLASWDDSDSSTHQFRIYFLCSIWKHTVNPGGLPDHVHFSNHPGFSLNRQKEFLQANGDQTLRVLQMVKKGCSKRSLKAPPLDTFEILMGCDTNITEGHLSKDNIESLVDKAIDYLMDLSPSKNLNDIMTRSRNAPFKSCLDVRDEDRVEGSLYRFIHSNRDVRWLCKEHALKDSDRTFLEGLTEFLHSHGGHIDMQQSTLSVELSSASEADQFLSLLTRTKHSFGICIKLNWKPTRSDMESLFKGIAKTKAVVLEIDGVTHDSHPQKGLHYARNLFAECHATHRHVDLVVLRAYPRPHEQSINTANCSLQTKFPLVISSCGWTRLRTDLEQFRDTVSVLKKASKYGTLCRKLQLTLAKYGLTDVTEVTIYHKLWNATIDLLEGTSVEIFSSNLEGPRTLFFLGSLQKLTLDLADVELDQKLYRMVQANPQLQELNISTLGRDVLLQVEPIVRLCHNSSRPLILTLFDRTQDNRGRVVAQAAIGIFVSIGTQGSDIERLEVEQHISSAHQRIKDTSVNPERLQWDCDHIFFQFSDFYAAFLDKATVHQPSVLTSLSLDISTLSEFGIACIQRVLTRSDLEYLSILCVPFKPILSHLVAQALMNIPWHSLKFLVLTGDQIDAWLRLWPATSTPQLLALHVQGTGPSLTELSHTTVLTIHHLIYASPLLELHLGNIYLLNKSDWSLIVDGVDLLLLKTFGLCCNTADQFMSVTDAMDTFLSRFQTKNRTEVDTTFALGSFTLDIVSLSQGDRVRLHNILRRSTMKYLHIQCASFDHSLRDSFAQIIDVVPWSTLRSLVLSGSHINAWIRLLDSVIAPQLQRLIVQRTGSGRWRASRASALIVQKLIQRCSLLELKFENFQLQDRSDWHDIVESTTPMLRHIDMCDTTWRQFRSVKAAYSLYQTKRDGKVPKPDDICYDPSDGGFTFIEHSEAVHAEDLVSWYEISAANLFHWAWEFFRILRRKLTSKLLNNVAK